MIYRMKHLGLLLVYVVFLVGIPLAIRDAHLRSKLSKNHESTSASITSTEEVKERIGNSGFAMKMCGINYSYTVDGKTYNGKKTVSVRPWSAKVYYLKEKPKIHTFDQIEDYDPTFETVFGVVVGLLFLWGTISSVRKLIRGEAGDLHSALKAAVDSHNALYGRGDS